MADGKIVIDVQVNGRKLTELSDALKRLESEARRSGQESKAQAMVFRRPVIKL